ncbi:MAG: SUMF1/EgtB/PvdO family nonheme iron enzyme [Candidatus Sumerlaeota bacterium]|nr:SUMF1/EgtB/PvdO family nonheme iron enzyme [Candidatus Sumerlaeota bacterium]
MFCPECGARNAETAKFCQGCGKRMSPSGAVAAVHGSSAVAAAPSVSDAVPKVAAGDIGYMEGGIETHNVTNIYGMASAAAAEPARATKIGEHCQSCGMLLKDEYFICRLCGKPNCPDCRAQSQRGVCVSCEEAALRAQPSPPPKPATSPLSSPATPQDFAEDLGGGAMMKMIWIKPGKFLMGSPGSEAGRSDDEGPQHEVELDGFWMGKYQVTMGQFCLFVSETNYKTQADKNGFAMIWDAEKEEYKDEYGANWKNVGFEQARNHPTVNVCWHDAIAFCKWLSRKSNHKYRLPTEAEWEYACRAGTRTPFYFGETISTDQANYDGNYIYKDGEEGVFRERTTPVGSFPANAWGVHDMHGNVWEWCMDWYEEDYYAQSPRKNPTGPASGECRSIRGGSWFTHPDGCRSACRTFREPDPSYNDYGFRVVCVCRG